MKNSDSPFGSAGEEESPNTGGPDVSKLKKQLAEEDTSQLNVKIPRSLHKKLKMHCLETEQEMREVVRNLLVEYLSE